MVALAIVQIPFLTVMGLCAGGAVVLAVTAAQTLVPALLSLSGSRLITAPRASRRLAAAREAGVRVLVTALRRSSVPPAGARAARRRDPAPPRGGACAAHPPWLARRRRAAHEPDHPPGLRPDLRGIRARHQRAADRGGLRAGRVYQDPDRGAGQLLPKGESPSVAGRRLDRATRRQPQARPCRRRGRAQNRPERSHHRAVDQFHQPGGRRRAEAVRAPDLRHRSDGDQHRHLVEALVRSAPLPRGDRHPLRPVAVRPVPFSGRPDQGGPGLRAQRPCRSRCGDLRLPGRPPERVVRCGDRGSDPQLPPDPPDRRPVRPGHGLRGVPGLAYA